jgi:hypothetical protein
MGEVVRAFVQDMVIQAIAKNPRLFVVERSLLAHFDQLNFQEIQPHQFSHDLSAIERTFLKSLKKLLQCALNELGAIVGIVQLFEFCHISTFGEPLPVHQQPDLPLGLDNGLQGFFVEFENAAIKIGGGTAVEAAVFQHLSRYLAIGIKLLGQIVAAFNTFNFSEATAQQGWLFGGAFQSEKFFNLVRVDSPPLCGEEGKLQSESLGSGAGLLPYPVRLRRGSLI